MILSPDKGLKVVNYARFLTRPKPTISIINFKVSIIAMRSYPIRGSRILWPRLEKNTDQTRNALNLLKTITLLKLIKIS